MKAFLPEQTRVSQVHLRTANLKDAEAFYTGVLGLKARRRTGSKALLSAAGEEPALLALTEDSHARPRSALSTGLYHLAIRYPSRSDLRAGLPPAGDD